MGKARVLVCDDEVEILRYLNKILLASGVDAEIFSSGAALLSRLENGRRDDLTMLLLDVKMPGIDGMQVLESLKKMKVEIAVVIMTAYGSIGAAVDAMKNGAYDYVTKPFPKEKILGLVEKVLERQRLLSENSALKEELGKRSSTELVFQSDRFREVYDMACRVAASEANILVLGESGTGKELVAGLIHQRSRRKGQQFLSINCAALSDTLLESQLFGHVRGAFTGAIADQKGLLDEANGGTLFLDEIGDMSRHIQAKLLRVIQEREFMPVGDTRTRTVDVRIIAATNRDLEEEVRQGNFREDLYFRLNVINLKLPPLRERKEDIIPLARHFLKRFCLRMNKEIGGFSPECVQMLTAYSWPGNIRELENVVERATILTRGPLVTPDALPVWTEPQRREPAGDRLVSLEEVEREHILHVLKKTGYVKTRAAQVLGIARRTLDRKIEEYGLEPVYPEPREYS